MIKDVLLSGLLLLIMYSGCSVMLHKPEPGKKIKVFILAGQSNMEGRADANKLLPPDQERLLKAQENGHYNYEAMKKLGSRFAEVFLNTFSEAK